MAEAASFQAPGGGGRRQSVGIAVGALLLLALAWYIYRVMSDVGGVAVQPASPTVVDMLPPPPPPPPPPEPLEQPPEPIEPTTATPEPMPTPDQPTPAPMQIDGPAQAGTDAYGVSAGRGGGMGAPSSAGTCVSGNCGGAPRQAGGISDSLYSRYLSGQLQARVQRESRVNRFVFSADFAVWISPAGAVTKVELLKGSGDSRRDEALSSILDEIAGLNAPPASFRFPQKITVRGRRSI